MCVCAADQIGSRLKALAMAAAAALLMLFLSCMVGVDGASSLVPAIITFGDSSVDVGNNNYWKQAMFKADFLPYGRDFTTHLPTGRFCNGKLATDYSAETLGFGSYPPAYLGRTAVGRNLLIGANFASAGSGYYDMTSLRYKAIPLTQQLEYYKEYRLKLARVAGKKKAASILSEAMYIIGTGNGDYLQNYYINPSLRRAFGPDDFSSLLVTNFSSFVKELHGLGASRIGVTSLPPLGCLPAAINLHGKGRSGQSWGCVSRLNNDAHGFNRKLRAAVASLAKDLPGLKMAVLDIYKPLLDLITNPSKYGFEETTRGCCGTGTSGTSVLCRSDSPRVCSNATAFVFWDGVHPSQQANRHIAGSVLLDGIILLS